MYDIVTRLEKKLGRYAIENLTLYLIIGQTAVFALLHSAPQYASLLPLIPERVIQGQYWRLVTFLFIPFNASPLWVLFTWYLFYLMGSALEQHWGTFRYNLYVIIACVATVGTAFLTPGFQSGNYFIYTSVFLAFAHLNPDFVLHLFFIIPVKMKWLALLTWFSYGYGFIQGGWSTRFDILAAVLNFFIFFGYDIVYGIRNTHRRMQSHVEELRENKKPRHVCVICGKNSITHEDMDFRYCTACTGQKCYCQEHINNHEHVTQDP